MPVPVTKGIDPPRVRGGICQPDKTHAIGISGIWFKTILLPGDNHRTFSGGIFIDILESKILGKAVRCRHLNGFTSIHPSHEITEVFDVGSSDSPHVFLKDVSVLGYIPADEFFNHWIGIVFEHRSLGIVMGHSITQHREVVHHPLIGNRGLVQDCCPIDRVLHDMYFGSCSRSHSHHQNEGKKNRYISSLQSY